MLLKLKEVAHELGLSVKYVRRLIATGALHAVRIGRLWRVDEDDRALFVAKRRI